MNKISIVRRRFDCPRLGFTQAEVRASRREARNTAPGIESSEERPIRTGEERQDFPRLNAAFLLSQKQASSFESIIESAQATANEMRAVFKRTGSLLVLRLYAVRQEKHKYLTSKDVAEMLALSRDTIYRLVRERDLSPIHHIGHQNCLP